MSAAAWIIAYVTVGLILGSGPVLTEPRWPVAWAFMLGSGLFVGLFGVVVVALA